MPLNRNSGSRIAHTREYPVLSNLDLRQRLRGLVLARFAVAAAMVFGAFFARNAVGIEQLDVGALCVLAAVLCGYNAAVYLVLRPYHRDDESAEVARVFLERVLHFSVAADFIGLTVALWLVGGPYSPFQAFFIFHVIIASVLLSRRAAFAHASVAFALLSGLVIGTWFGWIPGRYPEGAVAACADLTGQYVLTVLTVQGLLIMLTAYLTTHLVHVLRLYTERLVETNQKLERVSRLRRDFLHIALHNLRSPVGVVSMHMSNLAHGYGGPLTADQQHWVERSQARLHELSRFLNDLEYLAALEADELDHQMEPVDLGALAAELVEENRDLAEKSGHTLRIETGDGALAVSGIARLIREAIANYITNAIKYTPRGGEISVRVLERGQTACVEVEDTGIGIAPADQGQLFHEMVRIAHGNAEIGDVAGSGLGLYIVQRIAEMHGAKIGVRSQVGAGSTFFLCFPKLPGFDGRTENGYNTRKDSEGRDHA